MEHIPNGSITSPIGFLAAATACGLKDSGMLDLALILSEVDCSGAGTFTRNKVVAAPVVVDKETLAINSTRLRGILANAGIANACTGPKGLEAAQATQRFAAEAFDCSPDQVLLLSTGVIGVPLDTQKIANGIKDAVKQLSSEHGIDVARAIMTTDTHPKYTAFHLEFPEGIVTIGGMAKGAGMIHPDMATMLAVFTTDAIIPPKTLNEMLLEAVDRSFNRITIDGDTSTNDTVLLLANGASGVSLDDDQARRGFHAALEKMCVELAQAIVRDGEGVSKFVTLRVTGALTDQEALRVAQTIATSPLVKTAFAGSDPNWGRILAAAGRANVDLDPDRLALFVGSVDIKKLPLVQDGAPVPYNESQAVEVFASSEFTVHLDLGQGEGSATIWTCDLTHEYITINADYRT